MLIKCTATSGTRRQDRTRATRRFEKSDRSVSQIHPHSRSLLGKQNVPILSLSSPLSTLLLSPLPLFTPPASLFYFLPYLFYPSLMSFTGVWFVTTKWLLGTSSAGSLASTFITSLALVLPSSFPSLSLLSSSPLFLPSLPLFLFFNFILQTPGWLRSPHAQSACTPSKTTDNI